MRIGRMSLVTAYFPSKKLLPFGCAAKTSYQINWIDILLLVYEMKGAVQSAPNYKRFNV